ncbi:MAG: PilN domain-containing protein [Planctomycetota bacterium]
MSDPNQVAGPFVRRWLLVVAIGLVFVWGWWSTQTLRNAEYANAVATEALAAEMRLRDTQHVQTRQQQALVRRASLIDALAETTPRSAILRALGNALPTGVALEQLRLSTQRQNTDDATRLDYDVSLAIVGRADTTRETSAFMSRLRTSHLFSDEGGLRVVPTDKVRFEAELDVEVGL